MCWPGRMSVRASGVILGRGRRARRRGSLRDSQAGRSVARLLYLLLDVVSVYSVLEPAPAPAACAYP
eukprot:scaffold18427_cov61-Phaeocystis_antarctica.AAC.6